MDFDLVSRLVFPAPAASYSARSFPEELIAVPRSLNPQTCTPEDCVPMLLLREPGARYLLIFFHANSEDIGRCRDFCARLRDALSVHVLAVEYPGYGICPVGTHRDERGANECAMTALRFAREVLAWPAEYIALVGHSIGTGPAIALAAQAKVGALLLIAPFLSIQDVGREAFGYMATFIRERFPNKELMSSVQSPCLIVHGQEDSVVSCRHGQELYELCASQQKLLKLVPGLAHDGNVLDNPEWFLDPVADLLSLPESCFEELHVPQWAFELCAALAPTPLDAKVPEANFQGCTCTAVERNRKFVVYDVAGREFSEPAGDSTGVAPFPRAAGLHSCVRAEGDSSGVAIEVIRPAPTLPATRGSRPIARPPGDGWMLRGDKKVLPPVS